MQTGELICEKREVRPKGLRHQLRRNGRVPAVLYGSRNPVTAVSLSATELKAWLLASAKARIVKLKSTAAELNGKHVIIKELQRAPVSREILHADLYEVDLNRAIRVRVPLKFVGRAAGVALGGILQPLEREVGVECLPLEIPEYVEADVTELGIHDVIHVSSIKFAGNVKPIFDTDYPVVTVLPPTVEAAPAPPAAEVAAVAEGIAPAEGAAAPAESAKEAGTAPTAAARKA